MSGDDVRIGLFFPGSYYSDEKDNSNYKIDIHVFSFVIRIEIFWAGGKQFAGVFE